MCQIWHVQPQEVKKYTEFESKEKVFKFFKFNMMDSKQKTQNLKIRSQS